MTKVKEELFDYLKEKSLMPEYDKDENIIIMSQMSPITILFNDKDERYLQIVLPGIFHVDKYNRFDVLDTCNAVSAHIKIVKCLIPPSNEVYLSAEMLLDKTPNYEDIIPRTLRALIAARMEFIKEINK